MIFFEIQPRVNERGQKNEKAVERILNFPTSKPKITGNIYKRLSNYFFTSFEHTVLNNFCIFLLFMQDLVCFKFQMENKVIVEAQNIKETIKVI